MKFLKVLGVTCLVSGAAAFGTYVYNGVRKERMQKMFWDEMTVEKYNPVKYQQLRNEKVYDGNRRYGYGDLCDSTDSGKELCV